MFKLVKFVHFSFSCIFGSLLLCRFLLLFFSGGNFHCGNFFFFLPFFQSFFWHSLVANSFSSLENIKSHKTLWYGSWNIKLQKFNRKKKKSHLKSFDLSALQIFWLVYDYNRLLFQKSFFCCCYRFGNFPVGAILNWLAHKTVSRSPFIALKNEMRTLKGSET